MYHQQVYFIFFIASLQILPGTTDIDECTLKQPCHSNATCNNTVGSFICTCDTGYSGAGFNCSDIDECTLNQPCHSNATCNITVGSFICTCDTGYGGDGFNCSDIDEYTLNQPCHANATCNNTVGSFICTCDTGYSGDGFNCTDIDECTINQTCHANAICNNTVGSFICTCDSGYSGDGFNCSDIDECILNQPCHANATCNNTVGSFICVCDTGYSSDGFKCTDIDECTLNPPCHSNTTCNNTVGSFICTCDTGYSGDGFNCSDIDECTLNQPCHANATCHNIVGSFICMYDAGYACRDGFDCTDIDECTLKQPCHSNATCKNTVGSFTCTCDSGYSGDGFSCSDFNECKSKQVCPSDSKCENNFGSFLCICHKGFLKSAVGKCVTGDEKYKFSMLFQNEDYLDAYASTSSAQFKAMSKRITDATDKAYESNRNYLKSYVLSLLRGSVIASIQLVFENQESEPLLALKIAIKADKFGDLNVDIDSINVTSGDSCLKKPCSPNANCTDLKDGQYRCTCKEGFFGNGIYCEGFVEVNAEIVVEEVFTQELANKSSKKYKEVEKKVKDALVEVFKNTPDFLRVEILGIRNGSLKIDFKVIYKTKTPTKKITKVEIVIKILQKETEDGSLGNLTIAPQQFVIKEPPPPPVNISHTDVKETQITVKWDPPNLSELFSINSYLIIYHPLDKSLIEIKKIVSNERNGILDNLKSDTFYEIYLFGTNEYGTGENSKSIRIKTTATVKDNHIIIIVSVVVAAVVVIAVAILIGCRLHKRSRTMIITKRRIKKILDGSNETGLPNTNYRYRSEKRSSPIPMQNLSSRVSSNAETFNSQDDV